MSCIEIRLFVLQNFKSRLQFKNHSGIYFAGQMTGVEGYVESAQSGIVAGMNMVRYLNKQNLLFFHRKQSWEHLHIILRIVMKVISNQ